MEKLKNNEELEKLVKYGDVNKYLATLENRCSVRGKRNSKGNMDWRIGYKAHLVDTVQRKSEISHMNLERFR